MVVNLLPCMALQKGTMLLAVIDAMISIVNVGTLVIGFLIFDKDDPDFSNGEKIITLVVLIVVTIMCILQIALAFKLYMAAINKNYKSCRLWMIISAVVLIINVLNTTVDTATTDFEGTSLAGNVIAIIYKIYEMLVVYAFLQELKSNEAMALKTSPQLGIRSGSPVFTTEESLQPQHSSYPMQTFNYQASGQTAATTQLGPMVVTGA
ncbi:hypothetical protein Ocin01_09609 [Orchesella cincta]|uniref:Transmembrane protein n=1 Tax=Orchesella cincta TaxID=48709 RepID=A0A1D2MVW7_ORCCI|nr:hypothetical protein Ocin01_09609 [Orchesella cincta]